MVIKKSDTFDFDTMQMELSSKIEELQSINEKLEYELDQSLMQVEALQKLVKHKDRDLEHVKAKGRKVALQHEKSKEDYSLLQGENRAIGHKVEHLTQLLANARIMIKDLQNQNLKFDLKSDIEGAFSQLDQSAIMDKSRASNGLESFIRYQQENPADISLSKVTSKQGLAIRDGSNRSGLLDMDGFVSQFAKMDSSRLIDDSILAGSAREIPSARELPGGVRDSQVAFQAVQRPCDDESSQGGV